MFKTETVHLVPNLLAKSAEDDEADNKRTPALLKDVTNTRNRSNRLNKPSKQTPGQQTLVTLAAGKQAQTLKSPTAAEKPNQASRPANLKNLLINFDSEEEDISEDQNNENQVENVQDVTQPLNSNQKECLSKQVANSAKKNCLLLAMDSEDDDDEQLEKGESSSPQQDLVFEQEPAELHQQGLAQQSSKTARLQPNSRNQQRPGGLFKKQFLLAFQPEDEEQEYSEKLEFSENCSEKEPPTIKKVVIRLAGLLGRFASNYYLQPIPQGAVFECVIKRDKCESLLKYHLYDCISLRNFMTVIKDEDGYLIVSKELDKSTPGTILQKETVVGRVVSNFFGTEFNCSLENTPYLRGYRYPPSQDTQKVVTIEYQTNLFGLKGPRKISAFIASEGQKKYQNLNDIYYKQTKKKLKPTVLRFKNKTPKWCRQVNAYVLNFGGRASVSSIKNFIMVGENEDDNGSEAVLFGKFGRELFNLDVRYPFSIIQAVSLALSSFDRKLACE